MISIIMGVYNSDEKKLNYAVKSILNQTYKNFEFIICDDGSTNNTYEILTQFSNLDERIIIIKNSENRGLGFTLNKCISHAKSEFIVRQDDDDFSAPNRLEVLVNFHLNHPEYALVSSNIAYFDDNGIWGEMRYPEKPQSKDFLFCVPFMHGAAAYDKTAVLAAGGYSGAINMRRTEDIDLFMRMYANGVHGYTIEQKLYHFREDKNAVKKRKFRYRIDEARVKFKGYRMLKLMPLGIIYAIKPLVVGLLPHKLLSWLKDIHYNRKEISGE